MSETIEGLRANSAANEELRRQEGICRREDNAVLFERARGIAERAGLRLVRHSESHYALELPDEWLINVYPGNNRLYHDRKWGKPPYLTLPKPWTLVNVVQSAVIALNGTLEIEPQ